MSDSQTTDQSKTTDSTAEASVGALLCENRKRAGLDIADVARVLRISQKYLEALEEGRNADLPGTPYAIGFVRSYAEHLHLDGEEIVRRYKAEAEGLAGKTDLIFPKPIPDGGVPGTAVLGLGVIVAALAYGVWYWNSTQDNVEIVRVENVPEHMAAPKETPQGTSEQGTSEQGTSEQAAPIAEVAPAPSKNEPVAAASSPVVPDSAAIDDERAQKILAAAREAMAQEAVVPKPEPEPTPESMSSMNDEVAESVEADESAAEALTSSVEKTVQDATKKVEAAEEQVTSPAVEAEQAVEMVETPLQVEEASANVVEKTEVAAVPVAAPPVADSNGPSRVTVKAKSDSWIQVRDGGTERLLFSRLLRSGDQYEVPNRDGLLLMTGNAGALELLVDGDTVPAIGGMGELRRNVQLDPDKLKSGDAVSE